MRIWGKKSKLANIGYRNNNLESTMSDERLAPSSVLGLHHVGVSVRDLDSAIKFYSEATQLQILETTRISGELPIEPKRTAVLGGPNGYLELMQFDNTDPSTMSVIGPGPTHVCFQAPAEIGLYQKFKSLGANPVSVGNPPIDLNGRGVEYVYACDADNIMFEVEQLDAPRFEGPIWIAHIALACEDIDATVEFYRHLLGVEPYGRANKVMGPKFDQVTGLDNVRIRAAWFNTGNMVLELWQFMEPKTPSAKETGQFSDVGYNKLSLQVADLDAEQTRLLNLGYAILNEPTELHGVTELYTRDPDGNLLSLVQVGKGVSIADRETIDWLPSPQHPEVQS